MTRFVVDSSVVVKWFLPEEHTEAPGSLLGSDNRLIAPDLVRAEVGNVMWKHRRRGDIPAEAALGVLQDLGRLPLGMESSGPLGWRSASAAASTTASTWPSPNGRTARW